MTLPAWLFDRISADGEHEAGEPSRVRFGSRAGVPKHGKTMHDDTKHVTALRGADESRASDVLEVLYYTHAAALASFANNFLHSPSDARDVVADVFAAIWLSRHSFAPSGRIAAYFYTATRHRALNRLRDIGRRMRA